MIMHPHVPSFDCFPICLMSVRLTAHLSDALVSLNIWPLHQKMISNLTLKITFWIEHVKSFIVEWHNKGYPTREIHQKLLIPGPKIISAYSIMTNWIRCFGRDQDIFLHTFGNVQWLNDEILDFIASALEEMPFSFIPIIDICHQVSTHDNVATFTFGWLCCAKFASCFTRTLCLSKRHTNRNGDLTEESDWIDQISRLENLSHQWWILTWFFCWSRTYLAPWRSNRLNSTQGNDLQLQTNADNLLISIEFSCYSNSPKGIHFDPGYFCHNIFYFIHQNRPNDIEEDEWRYLVFAFQQCYSARCSWHYWFHTYTHTHTHKLDDPNSTLTVFTRSVAIQLLSL
jgi:hypothetical protein